MDVAGAAEPLCARAQALRGQTIAAPTLAPDIEPQPFFVRVTQGLSRMLQQRTGDGYVFRVDLRLRPDPASTQVG